MSASFTHHSEPNSPLHRFDARGKVVIALTYLIAMASTPPQHLTAFVVYAGLLLWMIALARVPIYYIAARAVLALPFSAFIALGMPFFAGGETIPVFGVTLSVAGLWTLAGATIKATLGLAAVVFLSTITPLDEMLSGLHRLGVPAFFLDVLALAIRYIHLLSGEARRMVTAAKARGYMPRFLPHAIIIGRMIGQLFVRSYERGARIHDAMHLRGFTGILPAAPAVRMTWLETGSTLVMLALFILVRVYVV